MIINDETTKNINKLLEKIEIDKNETDGNYSRMAKLKIQIRRMSRDAKSVQRSGNEKRIGEFNRIFIQSLAELSRLTQTTGQANRDEVAREVRRIKAQS